MKQSCSKEKLELLKQMDIFRLKMCMFPEEIVHSFKTKQIDELQEIILTFIGEKYKQEEEGLDKQQTAHLARLHANRLISFHYEAHGPHEMQMSLYGAFLDLA